MTWKEWPSLCICLYSCLPTQQTFISHNSKRNWLYSRFPNTNKARPLKTINVLTGRLLGWQWGVILITLKGNGIIGPLWATLPSCYHWLCHCSRKGAEQHMYHFCISCHVCHVTTFFKLLLPELPYHNWLYTCTLKVETSLYILWVAFVHVTYRKNIMKGT